MLQFTFAGVEIQHIANSETQLTIKARALTPTSACPSCDQASKHVHSYYARSPQDLPIGGRMVQLVLRVRRFRCSNPQCSRQTFAAWLRHHLGVEILSRDRFKDYRRGATDGAPLAQQVIDRWHMLKTLREAIERFLSHTQVPKDAREAPGLQLRHAKTEPVGSGYGPRGHDSGGLLSIGR